jgi:hypothetical protein
MQRSLPAVLCALLFLICVLISHPFAEMGIADDWSYFLTARILAQTGHIVYNGWATAMLGWQLYAGALFIKLFGASFTAVRMSTLTVSVLTTFLIQRTLVRSGINERNATIATLAVVLTPIYMQLSVTFMTDIQGMFAIVLCLYACIRALQTSDSRSATAWICFAVIANVVLGSARQIAWLGTLVIVPSTLWMLRKNRRLLLIGSAATLACWVGIFGAMHWFKQQPYSIPENISLRVAGLHGAIYMARQMFKAVLQTPFLVLPVLLIFLPWSGYAAVAIYLARRHSPSAMLEPLLGDWYTPEGFYQANLINGTASVTLGPGIRLILTITSIVATLCLVSFLLRLRDARFRREFAQPVSPAEKPQPTLTWLQLGYLLAPFTIAYFGLLIPRSTTNLLDRYLLAPSLVAAICMVRVYQDYFRRRLPDWSIALVVLTAIYSIGVTHDLFSLTRARVAIASEFQTAGISSNIVDGGFEYNYWNELMIAGHMNEPRVVNPPNSFISVDPNRGFSCKADDTKGVDAGPAHLVPKYGLSYTPDACAGNAPIPPVRYSRWLQLHPADLYVVNYQPHTGNH